VREPVFVRQPRLSILIGFNADPPMLRQLPLTFHTRLASNPFSSYSTTSPSTSYFEAFPAVEIRDAYLFPVSRSSMR
jgi:hypothetical protein